MKKIRSYILIHVTLILSLLHHTSFGQAQGYTNIPDINFENALWRYDDTPRDGRVPTDSISEIEYLYLSTIHEEYDLTGIEDMVNLREVSYFEQDFFSVEQEFTTFSSEELYALVEKYAAQIRHAKNETTFMSSADWFIEGSALYGMEVITDKKIGGDYIYHPLIDQGYLNDDSILTYQEEIYDPVLGKPFRDNIIKTLLVPSHSLRSGNKETAKAYVRIRDIGRVSHSVKRCIEIQYYYFFPFQRPANMDPTGGSAHDGDWEGYSVILNDRGFPVSYVNTRHGDPVSVGPLSVDWTGGVRYKGHPIMYTAMKTHAFYDRAKRRSFFGQDRTDNDGYKFDTWKDGGKFEIVHIDPSIKTDLVPTSPHWLDFKGYWGIIGTNGTGVSGPTEAGNDAFWNNEVYEAYSEEARYLPNLQLVPDFHGKDAYEITSEFTISFSERTYNGEPVTWTLVREGGYTERFTGEDESINIPYTGYRGSLRIFAQYDHEHDGSTFIGHGEKTIIVGPRP